MSHKLEFILNFKMSLKSKSIAWYELVVLLKLFLINTHFSAFTLTQTEVEKKITLVMMQDSSMILQAKGHRKYKVYSLNC